MIDSQTFYIGLAFIGLVIFGIIEFICQVKYHFSFYQKLKSWYLSLQDNSKK